LIWLTLIALIIAILYKNAFEDLSSELDFLLQAFQNEVDYSKISRNVVRSFALLLQLIINCDYHRISQAKAQFAL